MWSACVANENLLEENAVELTEHRNQDYKKSYKSPVPDYSTATVAQWTTYRYYKQREREKQRDHKKIRRDISSESSAEQRIHLKHQVLFRQRII